MIRAKLLKLPPNLDTDQIIPAKYLNTTDPKILRIHCLEGVRENFYKEAEGAVVVGGANFGRGSSREHAPLAMKACRIKCIIAPSFSPIFLRNSLNIGLYTIFANIYEDVEEGEEIIVDIKRGLIKYKEKEYSFPPLPLFVQKIVECGGLLNYAKLS